MKLKVEYQHLPQSVEEPSRRQFLKRFMGAAAASTLFPVLTFANSETLSKSLENTSPSLPPAAANDENYWHLVKEQFPIRPGLIMMNAANLCPSPYPVFETLFDLSRDVDADITFQNRSKFRDIFDQTLQALGTYLGAEPDELVVTRNTTEGNNLVINGLDLQAGDEVVIWDQNHPTNNVAWDVRAQRFGFTVKRVSTPAYPKTQAELAQTFLKAFNKNTKVLAFSHVSNISGVALPAQELCQKAREKGILTLIDGAQTFGVTALDLHDLGCDFFTGSAHKWFLGPKETGILYIRKDRIEGLWPMVVGVGWEKAREKGARKFNTFGQRDDAAIAAMGKTALFHNQIGKEKVAARVGQLTTALQAEIREQIPDARFISPQLPELNAGIVVFTLPNVDLSKVLATLYHEHNIGCTVLSGDFKGIRLSPHIYNTLEEVETVVKAIKTLV
ncbi:MAG: aminotransferase class V-fold PLP-dependent enzyme [bacterium]